MNWKYKELAKTLGGIFYVQHMIVELLINSGLSPGEYELQGDSGNIFTRMIHKLDWQGKLMELLLTAREEYPNNPVINDAIANPTGDTWHKSVYAGPEVDFYPGTAGMKFEKLIYDQSSLLPIGFLDQGIAASRAVARIVTSDSLGTGFLVSGKNLLLTNNHVISDKRDLGHVKIQFNYQRDHQGKPLESVSYSCDPDFFQTSVTDDWTLIKLNDNPVDHFNFLSLKAQSPETGSYVNIIQHPGGEYKQIGLYHNIVNFVSDDKIRYFTDTLPGSSGSPVFDSQWNVVALHHSGGYFPVKNGSKILCNEGIHINKVLSGIENYL